MLFAINCGLSEQLFAASTAGDKSRKARKKTSVGAQESNPRYSLPLVRALSSPQSVSGGFLIKVRSLRMYGAHGFAMGIRAHHRDGRRSDGRTCNTIWEVGRPSLAIELRTLP